MKGDAFEAFIGAMYLDKGYEYSKKIIVNHIINYHFDIDVLENLDTNFKSKLIEWAQKEKKSVEFNVIDEVGSGYNKQYVVEILVEKKSMGKGQDFSIKSAEQNASEKAWKMLEITE
jgi:ribonuclease-3